MAYPGVGDSPTLRKIFWEIVEVRGKNKGGRKGRREKEGKEKNGEGKEEKEGGKGKKGRGREGKRGERH